MAEINKMKNFFYKVALLCYLCGLPNFWIEDLKLPKWFMKFFDIFTKINNAIIYCFIAMEEAAFFTQENLSDKQKSDMLVFVISHPILYGHRIIVSYHEHTVREVMYDMVFKLKTTYNDLNVESQMIRKSLLHSGALIFSCFLSMFIYTLNAFLLTLKNGTTFNVVFTAWPNVDDTSTVASVARVISYLFWWIFMTRVFGAYILVICLTTSLSHQYRNLQSYFENLNNIFELDVSQEEKERRYEEGFKVGIGLHFDTLQCTKQSHLICHGVFSGQIVFNVILLVLFMVQMAHSERTLVHAFGTLLTAFAVLISTGFFVWNAGDVTVEASHLSTAMYISGWHNCQGKSSIRVRKLVVITMSNAQKPVVLKSLGIVNLSYQSYLSIVKSSYSVFSVLY